MRSRATEIEAGYAGEVPGREAALQQLVAEHLAVEDVPAGQPEARLELARAEREALDDPVGEAGARLGEARDGRVGGGLGVDAGREALAEQRQDVAARGRERRGGGGLARRLGPRAGGGAPPARGGARAGGAVQGGDQVD